MMDMATRIRQASLSEVLWAYLRYQGVSWLSAPLQTPEMQDRVWAGHAIHAVERTGRSRDDVLSDLAKIDNAHVREYLEGITS